MKQEDIYFLKCLDPEGMDGTIQAILLDEYIMESPTLSVMRHLVKSLYYEKRALVEDNKRLSQLVSRL